uniref:AIG1-type G domain-containing protein n=1 Tax=Arion vulgaris TaxID=1028688 RepID=A0A0B7AT59_9EUPU
MAVDLLLVGREGNGKSSTGNSILNQKVFIPRTATSQVSSDINKRTATIDGKTVNVVDGLSLLDSSTDGVDNVRQTIGHAERALSQFARGCNAVIIVLKYGIRFTNQEKNAVNIIRSLFGENIIKNYGVIVMTYGDNFANDMEENGTTFETWCQNQTGDVRDLFRECGNRFVLFNNKTNDSKQIKEQFRNLMSKVDEVKKRDSHYTLDTFRAAKFGQRKLIVQSKLSDLQTATNNVLDFVTQSLRKLDESFYSPSNYINELDRLKYEVDRHKAFLEVEDEGTNSISQLKLQISITEASISTKKERHLRKIEYDNQILTSSTSGMTINAPPQVKIVITFVVIFLFSVAIYFFFF